MPGKPPATTKSWHLEIEHAKALLDIARRAGDRLKAALAEDALNDLLDRYSYYISHTSQREK